MVSLLDYAALSAIVYNDARQMENKLLPYPPVGWTEMLYTSNPGFTAGAYQNGNDIVIAFKGSDLPSFSASGLADWVATNLQAGLGLGSTQLVDAALFYEAVKDANPGANITFTGHSLGGGLASVLSVWFDKPATTFAEAPFLLSAVNPLFTVAVAAKLLLNGIFDSDFAGFVGGTPLSTGLRASNVQDHYVSGEVLSVLRGPFSAIYGTDTPIDIGGGNLVSSVDLHSIVLTSALLMQDKLRQDTIALPALLREIFDEGLYAAPLTGNHRDFLNSLLNDQIKLGYANADGLLARFSGDISKLAQYGANLKDGALGKALMDVAIGDYYFMQSGFTTDFFNAIGGGLSFDLSGIGADWAGNKTVVQLDKAVAQAFNLDIQSSAFLAGDNVWSIQSGADALTAVGSGTSNDAMLGGSGGDSLDGGAGNDFLYGGSGADTLTGGTGSDLLEGGAGNDTYYAGDGDRILDSDGQGKVYLGDVQLTDGNQDGIAGIYKSADGVHSYTLIGDMNAAGGATLMVDGSLTIEHFHNNDLGISFAGGQNTAPSTTLTLSGDFMPIVFGTDSQGNDIYHYDALGNVIVDPGQSQTQDDILYGSTGNDHILSGGGRDFADGKTGDDLVEGGAGADILAGGAGNDLVYGDGPIAMDQAIANGETDVASGSKGDWLAGNSGDDTLVGGAGNDVLSGGGGSDQISAGAGDDYILGDADYVAEDAAGNPYFDWTVTVLAGGASGDVYQFNSAIGIDVPVDGAADVIYAGAGNDQVFAGAGDDVVYGGSGDDTLRGESGNDVLIGEAGDDELYGGAGANYLDGGDGSDTLNSGGPGSTLLGGANDDDLAAAGGGNYLDGGDGNDTLIADGGGNILIGGAGNDALSSAGTGNTLDGGDGNDVLAVDGSGNTLQGGSGGDQLNGGSAGENYLDGGDGNDILQSSGAGNSLIGAAGDDNLTAAGGDNYLDGGDGSDFVGTNGDGNTLIGSGGDDTLVADLGGGNSLDGGAGNDLLSASGAGGFNSLDGGDGNDTLSAEGGNNTLAGGAGDDTLSAAGGNSYLDGGDGADYFAADGGGNTETGGAGDDSLSSTGGNSSLYGGDGNDTLTVDGGDNTLFGNAGDDSLHGGSGADTLAGGSGDDTLSGGDGNDVYVYNVGDGVDTLYDSGANGQVNTLRFGDGIVAANIVLGLGSLKLDLGNGDVIHIAGFDPNDAANSSTIQSFEFADGTILSAQQLITAQGFDLAGTAGNDVINGTDVTDRITGGAGDDTLAGGAGSDIYFYDLGDGNDTIVDSSGGNTLSFGAGVTADMLTLHVDNATGNLTLDIGSGQVLDSIAIGSLDAPAIQTLQFSDGASFGIGDLPVQHPSGIIGTDAAETLAGTSQDDIIQGKGGGDTLVGGAGSDTYLYDIGDGADVIVDSTGSYFDPFQGNVDLGSNTLSFGAGITPDMVRVRIVGNDCVLDLGNGDSITVAQGIVGNDANWDGYLISLDDSSAALPINFNADPFGAFSIQTLAFQDSAAGAGSGSTTLNLQDFILQHGVDQTGTNGADTLVGDSLYNSVIPGSIADRLEGGKGNDTLIGGSGDDTYVFNRGDGADTIVDATTLRWDIPSQSYLQGGSNTLLFGAGITAGDITATYRHSSTWGVYDTIVLDLGNGDSIDLGAYSDNLAVQNLQFADGSTINISDFLNQQGLVNVSTTSVWGENWTGAYNFPNIMLGLGGNDALFGGLLDDTLAGGTGNDYLEGRGGSDTYVFNQGDGTDFIRDDYIGANVLSLGAGIGVDNITPAWNAAARNLTLVMAGNDRISIGSLDDLAIKTLQFNDGTTLEVRDFLLQKGVVQAAGTAGGDVMATFANGQALQGLGGDDQLYGSKLDDTLEGGAGNDLLVGSAGNDTLEGGADSDKLEGGAGNDDYIYNPGDGADTIMDNGNAGTDTNTLSFGAGIDADMLVPVFDSATRLLTLYPDASTGDSVCIGDIDDPAIQNLQFVGAPSLTLDQFMAQMGEIVQTGTAGDDYMDGTHFTDRLEGLDGNDYISAWENDDTLIGGAGDDYLSGGFGNDTYFFNPGDGADTIDDSSFGPGQYEGEPLNEINTLVFGIGITPDMVTHTVNGNGQVVLDVGYGAGQTGDSVSIGYEDNLAIQRIRFADGAEFSIEAILSQQPPLASPIADQVTQQDAQFVFTVPQDAFIDPNPGGTLAYSAALSNGDLLPAWLTFDAATQTFGGSPANADVGSLDLTVTATDTAGLAVSSSFRLDVLNINDAPTVVIPLANQNGQEGVAFSIGIPAGAFTDPDLVYGDSLAYSATLAGGQPLPDWLVFDPVSLTLGGAAPAGSAGLFDIDIVATDTAGAIAIDPFQLNIAQATGANCDDGDHGSSGNDGNHRGSSSGDGHRNSPGHGGDHRGATQPEIRTAAYPGGAAGADGLYVGTVAGTLSGWSLTDALLNAHLAGSNMAALSGEPLCRSSADGCLEGAGLAAMQNETAIADCGISPQLFRPSAGQQAGMTR